VLAVAGMVAADVGFMAARHHGPATAATTNVAAAGSGDATPGAGADPAPAETGVILPTTTAPTMAPVTTPPRVRASALSTSHTAPTVLAPTTVQETLPRPPSTMPAPPAQPYQQPTGPPAANKAPVLPPHEDWDFTIPRDQTLTIPDDRFIHDATDPDGGPVYFVVVSFEGGGTASYDRYGHFKFSPNGPGTNVVRFRVKDEAGAESQQVNRIVITVT